MVTPLSVTALKKRSFSLPGRRRFLPNSLAQMRLAVWVIFSGESVSAEKQAGRAKLRIRFCLRTAAQLLDEAAAFMKEAKTVHDRLEEKYIAAMDFEKVGEKTAEFLATL